MVIEGNGELNISNGGVVITPFIGSGPLNVNSNDQLNHNISIPQESATDPRSQSINSQAIPILTSEALAAQSLQFDVVSGATYTSEAFAQSLQSALTKAGK